MKEVMPSLRIQCNLVQDLQEHDISYYSCVQKSIENFVFKPKMAIFRRAELRKERLILDKNPFQFWREI